MKKLFMKEVFDNPVTLEVISRSLMTNGKSLKPKELKGIKQFSSIKKRGKTLQLFIDNEFNLWYKDNSVIVGTKTEIINNHAKNVFIGDKIWFKITGLYERRNQFILDTLRELANVSEDMYVDNTIADNIALEDIYEYMLKDYYAYIKHEKHTN